MARADFPRNRGGRWWRGLRSDPVTLETGGGAGKAPQVWVCCAVQGALGTAAARRTHPRDFGGRCLTPSLRRAAAAAVGGFQEVGVDVDECWVSVAVEHHDLAYPAGGAALPAVEEAWDGFAEGFGDEDVSWAFDRACSGTSCALGECSPLALLVRHAPTSSNTERVSDCRAWR